MRIINISILFITFFLALAACKKDNYVVSGEGISFSKDTVFFDTIFTRVGSITKEVKIYNATKNDILIQSIQLSQGEESQFRLNIDGYPGNFKEDIRLRAKDSMYIFVEITIDPTLDKAPMVIEDSIVVITEDIALYVNLLAWGQNMNLYYLQSIDEEVWTNDKPYLIYLHAQVDSGKTLTIEAGTEIFIHRYSSLVVYGTLIVNGTKEEPVIFRNDRLDDLFEGYSYEEVPGQWRAIFFMPGSNNHIINYAIIKNGEFGLYCGSPAHDNNPNMVISNTIIDNMSNTGLRTFGANIEAYNLVISNTGYEAIGIYKGGKYNFTHCTVANYWDEFPNFSNRRIPSVVVSNYCYYPNDDYTDYIYADGNLEEANFYNSILYGNLHESEIIMIDTNIVDFNCNIDYCYVKINKEEREEYKEYLGTYFYEEDSLFIAILERDYQPDTLSAVIDKGSLNFARKYPADYNGNSRTFDGKPDLGAYEFKK